MNAQKFRYPVNSFGFPKHHYFEKAQGDEAIQHIEKKKFCWWYWMLQQIRISYTLTIPSYIQVHREWIVKIHPQPYQRYEQLPYTGEYLHTPDAAFLVLELALGSPKLMDDQTIALDFHFIESDIKGRYQLGLSPLYAAQWQKKIPLYLDTYPIDLILSGTTPHAGDIQDMQIHLSCFNDSS